jgi:16S rRNA (guanine966-N2)-methyltransferase
MRVIAGSAKGRKLEAVPGSKTRPITDRTKEALFSILGDWIIGARVLDLFAGTGAVGIEGLSRGAEFVRFVDKAGLAVKTIQANLSRTGLAERAQVNRTDVFQILRRPVDYPFDLVYVAPPQHIGLWSKTLETLDQNISILTSDGIAVAQIHPKEFSDLALSRLRLYDRRTYGSTQLCFYEPLEY